MSVLTASLPERAWLLDECKHSVAAQTVPVQHLVGIDDAREGPGRVRNRLAAVADTDWLLFLDDDDLLDPDCAETLLHHADADVVYPWCRVEGRDDWTPNRLFSPDALLRRNFIPVTALVRRAAFLGFQEDLTVLEDWHLWLRMLADGASFQCVPEVLWTYRVLAAGDSRNQWAAQAA